MRNVIALVLVMALGTAVSATAPGGSNSIPGIQDNVIFQDFENPSGWNGADPPSGWTVADNGQADGIWDSYDWSRYSAWGGATARVSGGSANRYNNDWIISPAIDFSSATACTLSFRQFYDDYLTQEADSALVLLSNNNGSTWGDTVMVYAGADYGSDTVPDSEYFSISSFAAGHSQVKVAFQYVKREAVVTGSWRIDDVKLLADGSPLLSQNFDSAWGPNGDNPPTDWTILDIQVIKWDDNDWHQTNIAGWGNIAYVYWSPIERQNEFLISPSMDFSDETNDIRLTLKQWYNHEPLNNSDTGFVLGSINGGLTWPETLAVYRNGDHGSLSSPAYDTLSIVSWANGQADVTVGFKYVGYNNGSWYIDSVGVERIDMFAHDVRVNSISAPPDTTIDGYQWPVSAVVQNVGIYPISFNVFFQIFDSTETLVYTSMRAVTDLPSLGQLTVDFDSWPAAEPNDHAIRCFTSTSLDLDHSNDTLYTSTRTFHHIGNYGPVEGWSYRDNITGDGEQFNWIDIRNLGTAINFPDPDQANSGMIDMGIDFYYFGQTYSRIAVSTDGWLSFTDSTGADGTPSEIPDVDGPAAMIALLWSDLQLETGHVYYYQDHEPGRFIVQYDSVEYVSRPGSQFGMEIIFDGIDHAIKMQYSYFTAGSAYEGTIGIENQTQDTGLPYDNNGQIGQTPQAGLAVTFTYLPPHDIRALSIDQPSFLIYDGSTYDVITRLINAGANAESFEVTASDDHGWSNTQLVSALASLDTATVVFPDWQISSQCDTFSLTVYSNLGEDLDRSNDTISVDLEATPPVNRTYIYDDGIIYAGITTVDTTDVVASRVTSPYENTNISAVAFRFLDSDGIPGRPVPDSFVASIFVDENNDGFPENQPIYSRRREIADSGWTVWNIGCDTVLTLNCTNFWVGFSIEDSAKSDTLAIDSFLDFPTMKWVRELGQWRPFPSLYGDFMIRAFVSADTTTGPHIALGSRHVIGAAQPDGIDTVGDNIQNIGTTCDLAYQVSVRQTEQEFFERPDPAPPQISNRAGQPGILNLSEVSGGKRSGDPPLIAASGGPDNFGYTWIDSDDLGGPVPSWIDISSMGTPVTWDHGDSDDGYTEPVSIGMTFNYYGINYDSVTISTNGWVSFGRAPEEIYAFSDNTPILYSYPLTNLLAVEWDNLTGGAAGHCYYYYDASANAFVISWLGWSHVPGEIDPHDFQIILDGTRGRILYQYQGTITQSGYTVGIENADGTDGLQVAYNQPYLHDGLAILFKLPVFWLSTDLAGGILPAASDPLPFNIIMSAVDIPGGTYNGSVIINSNDVAEPVTVINVQFQVESACSYVPGDVNGSGNSNGLDVVYMVNYFKGADPPHEECRSCADFGPGMIYPQGDVNGSCSWNGIDVTYFVSYLKGIWPSLRYCEQCPPGGRMTPISIKDDAIK
jgi:hypothetical protein